MPNCGLYWSGRLTRRRVVWPGFAWKRKRGRNSRSEERLSSSWCSSVREPLPEDTHSSSVSGSGSVPARRTGATGLGAGFGASGGRPLPTRAPLRGCTAGASGDAARGGSTAAAGGGRPAAGSAGQQPEVASSQQRPPAASGPGP
ncbi:unnamed protein product [Prorocentrum cordatum]|uniref:Uncharacterized protein n=1 Tax=Prorocentrum cordatum TaxID=2364126 RepID=A0ABN9PE01_9DINO|nr:unnamed protein product [Polarella glacialis]